MTATTMTAYRLPHRPQGPDDPPAEETLDQLIRRRRRELELSQARLAHALSTAMSRPIDAGRVSDWERGARQVPLSWLEALAAVLNLPFEQVTVAAVRARNR